MKDSMPYKLRLLVFMYYFKIINCISGPNWDIGIEPVSKHHIASDNTSTICNSSFAGSNSKQFKSGKQSLYFKYSSEEFTKCHLVIILFI